MKLACVDRVDSFVGSDLEHLMTSERNYNCCCENQGSNNQVRYRKRDHRLKRLRIACRGQACYVRRYTQAELHEQQSETQLAGTRKIIVLTMTPHQNNHHRNYQNRHHRGADDMRNDSERLMSKTRTKHKLDQHTAYGSRSHSAKRPAVGIWLGFAWLKPAPRREDGY